MCWIVQILTDYRWLKNWEKWLSLAVLYMMQYSVKLLSKPAFRQGDKSLNHVQECCGFTSFLLCFLSDSAKKPAFLQAVFEHTRWLYTWIVTNVAGFRKAELYKDFWEVC